MSWLMIAILLIVSAGAGFGLGAHYTRRGDRFCPVDGVTLTCNVCTIGGRHHVRPETGQARYMANLGPRR